MGLAMQQNTRRYLVIIVWFCCVLSPLTAAERPAVTDFVYARPQADIDIHSPYTWRVLRAALEHTRATDGDFTLRADTTPVTGPRRRLILTSGVGPITVAVFPAGMEITRDLVPVRIPITKGLLGYRLLFIHQDDQPRFDRIDDIGGLREISFGTASYWLDTEILRQAGIPVVDGNDYHGLFKMLQARRFVAFGRGTCEVPQEFAAQKLIMTDLAIEKHLLVHYVFPDYFWFTNDQAGRRRADRVWRGMMAMVDDGTMNALFEEEFGPLIKDLDFDHRRLIEIANPFLTPADPLADSRLWWHPAARSASR
jgi:hypothetical protein